MADRSSGSTSGWAARKGVARSIRIFAFLFPLLIPITVGYLLTSALPAPSSTAWGLARWVSVATVAALSFVVAERIGRRLIPLATLFRLSLAFPDAVPSRFGLALRIGTTMQLRRRIEETSTSSPGETPGEAAHRLLELVGLLSRHDRMTRGHSERVRAYTHVIGEELGISGRELDRLRWSALLHDVGKIRVPEEILNKPGRLTDEEFETIKTHPLEGKKFVEPLADWLGDSVRAVWEHHERFDGNGYPYGIAGTDIALASRIVCVADAYDVMTSTRSYKRPMSGADARAELSRHAGTQFDPVVVRAFLNASLTQVRAGQRRLTWFSQVALLPRAVVAQVGSSLGTFAAIGAAITAGVLAGSVGQALADRPESPRRSVVADDEREENEGPVGSLATVPASTDSADPEASSDPDGAEDRPADVGDETTETTGTDDDDEAADTTAAGDDGAPDTNPDDETITTDPTVTTTVTTTVPTTVVTVPTVTTTIPGTTVPDVTVPEITLPEITLPEITLPEITLPEITLPEITLPDITIPEVTLPDITVPTVTVPQVTVPQVTVPQVTVPTVTVPQVTVPQVTVPQVTVPQVTVPTVTLFGL